MKKKIITHKCSNPFCPGDHDDLVLFSMGDLMMTARIKNRIDKDPSMRPFLRECLNRHQVGDPGDAVSHRDEVIHLRNILKEREISTTYTMKDLVSETEIWIITKRDRTKTVVLFAYEYLPMAFCP